MNDIRVVQCSKIFCYAKEYGLGLEV